MLEIDEYDIAIIGGGVAGIAAAIAAQQSGYDSILLERAVSIEPKPGESIHPGLAPVVKRLGVLSEFEKAATGRFSGIFIRHTDGSQRFDQFGGTAETPWLGYHIPKIRLSNVLYRRALKLGCSVKFDTKVKALKFNGEKVILQTSSGLVKARWVIDSTGFFGFSARQDRTGYQRTHRGRIVRYSYTQQEEGPDYYACTPILQIQDWGWAWEAPLGNGEIAKVTLYNDIQARRDNMRMKLADDRFADGSWLVAQVPYAQKIFRVGDAAMRFDPSSGKGILRAIMTSMMAVHLIESVEYNKISESSAANFYNNWVHSWFRTDADILMQLHAS